jgi:hypothetical protein
MSRYHAIYRGRLTKITSPLISDMKSKRSSMLVNTTHSLFLITLYFVEFVVSTFTFISLTRHVSQRVRIGAVSGFMASLWLFLFFFSIQMLVGICLRLRETLHIENETYKDTVVNLWTASHLGTTTFITLVGVFIIKKRFDIFIVTKSLKELDKPREDD